MTPPRVECLVQHSGRTRTKIWSCENFLILYDHKEVWTCNCIMKINHSLFCFSVITLALLDTPRLRKIIFLT